MADKTGNMFWRGDWKLCFEYNSGDVVQRSGTLYMALEQSAGMDPLDPLNGKYWKLLLAPVVPPTTDHQELDNLQGGTEEERYHLTKNQHDGAVFARDASASNPFLTVGDLPPLERRVEAFSLAERPKGLGQLYGVTWADDRFVAVGDDCACVSPDGELWIKQAVPTGYWRGVAFGGGTLVAVGLSGTVMYSEDSGEVWQEGVAPPGDWNSVAFGNGMFVAVTDGSIMRSLDGRTQWVAKSVPQGYGISVSFGNGVFAALGNKGVMTSTDGETWEVRETPHSTWRALDYGDGVFLALSGRCMTSTDDGATWALEEKPPVGGWDALTYGGGFWVAVGGAYSCMVSPSGELDWELRDVPNFIWHALAFGKDTFVAVGSGIMYARIVDVSAALNNANAPNGTNIFVTMDDLKEMKAAIRVLYALLTWNGEPGDMVSWADVMGVNRDVIGELLNDILKWKDGA